MHACDREVVCVHKCAQTQEVDWELRHPWLQHPGTRLSTECVCVCVCGNGACACFGVRARGAVRATRVRH